MKLKVVLAQTDIVWEEPARNIDQLEGMLLQSDLGSADLVLLPELFSTGFSMAAARISTVRDGIVVAWMRDFARRNSVSLLGSHAELANGSAFNTAVLARPDGSIGGSYRKIHLFQDERNHYSPGERLLLFPLGGTIATAFICYDLRFPEVFRAAAAQGARVLLVVANWPAVRQEHWNILLRSRAIENQAFVCACNRTGRDPNESYAGGSCVIGPDGAVLMQLGEKPEVAKAILDLDQLGKARTRFDCLPDRRQTLYRQLFDSESSDR